METINNIELRDESIFPDQTVLSNILGDSFPAYQDLLRLYDENQLVYTWRYYHDGKAWLCKVQKKDRTIVWMSAWKGYMQATIYMPEKYMEQVYALDIDKELKDVFRNARSMGKSRACIFEVRTPDVLKDFEKVMLLKIKLK